MIMLIKCEYGNFMRIKNAIAGMQPTVIASSRSEAGFPEIPASQFCRGGDKQACGFDN